MVTAHSLQGPVVEKMTGLSLEGQHKGEEVSEARFLPVGLKDARGRWQASGLYCPRGSGRTRVTTVNGQPERRSCSRGKASQGRRAQEDSRYKLL